MALSSVSSRHFMGEAVDLLHDAEDRKKCLDAFGEIAGAAGYSAFIHVLLDPRLPVDQALHTTTSQEWQDAYLECSYQHHDPILIAGTQSVVPMSWSDVNSRRGIFKGVQLTKKSEGVMHLAEDFQFQDGLSLAVHSGRKALVTCYVSAPTKEEAEEIMDVSSAKMSVLMLHLHERLNRLAEPAPVVRLTPRQAEILSWVAAGKTNVEIALIMGISRETVSSHLRVAMERLDVHTRAQAAAKAIQAGTISGF